MFSRLPILLILAFASGFFASALALSACGDDAPASVDAGAPDLGPVCTYDGGDEAQPATHSTSTRNDA